VAVFNRSGVPKLQLTRSIPWYSDEGEMRSTLSAVLNLYGFSLVETEIRPDKKGPGLADNSQFDLFDK
jgi:hypothetical protein